MPTTSKPKRVPFSISLTPDVAARLQRESDDRLLNPSVLVEKGLGMLFASFDKRALASNIESPKP